MRGHLAPLLVGGHMCGRYFASDNLIGQLEKSGLMPDEEALTFKGGEVFPSMKAPLVMSDGSVSLASWGLGLGNASSLVINARAEGILQKKFFQRALKTRILIPMTYFYEWDREGFRHKFYLPGDFFYIGGLMDTGKDGKAFTMVTKAANESMEKVHHRMPLIIKEENIGLWLSEDFSQVFDLAMPEVDMDSEASQLSLF